MPLLDKSAQRHGEFLINEDGLFYVDTNKDISLHVCSPVTVVATTSDADGCNWGKLVWFPDPKGNEKHHHFLNSVLMSSDKSVISELVKKGLILSGNPRAKNLLVQYLRSEESGESMLSSVKPGWVRGSFVLPNGSHGPDEIIYAGTDTDHGHAAAGDWKNNVGRFCSGNSRLILAASAAFAAPLLELVEMEGGGFHVRGSSSTGKSTTLEVAASVYGPPSKVMLNWDATKNSMEEVAEVHNDQLMIIDELGMVDGSIVGETIYMLANGIGKARMGTSKRRWRVLTFTSGEVSLAEQMAKAGKVPMRGQEVRLLDIPADAGAGMGVIEKLHSFHSSADLVNHLKAATRRHYGVLTSFLTVVTSRQKAIRSECRKIMDTFTALVTPTNPNGQVSRAIRRFSLVAAAGEIATSHGLTGWRRGEAMEAARKCFLAWMNHRNTYDPQLMAINRVKEFIVQHQRHFEVLGGKVIRSKVGYRKKTAYLVLPEIFRNVVCSGINHDDVALALEEAGYLVTSGKNRLTYQQRIPGQSKAIRLYCINDAIEKAA